MPYVERYVLLLGQHIGAPSRPIVARGDRVRCGQLVAEPGGFVSAALHSPVTGEVIAVEPRRGPDGSMSPAIEIATDPWATHVFEPAPPPEDAFVPSLQRSGLVGLGGAAFPTHVKYAVPDGKQIEHLVLNGCECEPYLTCDHRTMVERAGAVLRGARLAAEHLGSARLGSARITIGVEANKPDGARALRDACGDPPVNVRELAVKYPQGAEKLLIRALLGLTIPTRGLPLDLGVVVGNVGSMAALADWFDAGRPLIERAVTVSGPGVPRPANLIVPIGTPVRAVLEHCGGPTAETEVVVMGGPMMGRPLPDLDVPVVKGTSGILALTRAESRAPEVLPCVRCGRCLEACAYFLNPSRLGRLARVERWPEMADYGAMDCMECGACSFACPSGIPLVHLIRIGRAELRKQARRDK